MKDIILLINSLPDILSNIIYGFVFISIYHLVTRRQNDSNKKYLIMCSIALSFVIKLIFNSVVGLFNKFLGWQITINSTPYYLVLLLITVIVAYGIGKIVDADWFDNILQKLGIDHTVRPTIWDDTIKNYTEVDITLRGQPDMIYNGQVKFVEEDEREPIIVLLYYKIIDKNQDRAIVDYTLDDDKTIMLNYKDIEKIEFKYS